MRFIFIIVFFIPFALTTPPACFLGCINAIAHICPQKRNDVECLCAQAQLVLDCITELCWGINYYSARDHFKGTCMEHHFNYGDPGDNPTPASLPYLKPFDTHYNHDTREEPKFNEELWEEDDCDELDESYEEHASDEFSSYEDPMTKERHILVMRTPAGGQLSKLNKDSPRACDQDVRRLALDKLPDSYDEAPIYCYETRDDEQGILTEECFKYIPYASRSLPATTRYLERFYIPHCLHMRSLAQEGAQ